MDSKAKILLVEDDFNLGQVTQKRLEAHGYEVVYCSDGETAWRRWQTTQFDLCLLDIILPRMDGYLLARYICSLSDKVPILFLSSKGSDEDKIAGFKAGADDYLVKPFSMQELLYRVAVFLKRTRPLHADKVSIYQVGSLYFNYPELKILDTKGVEIATITQKEADLLKYLCENPNTILKRKEVLFNVWGKDDYFLGRSMDVFITKLRKRFEDEKMITIKTVHGVGYIFDASVTLKK